MKPLFVSDMFVLFNVNYITDFGRYKSRHIIFNRISYGIAGAMLMDLMVYKKIDVIGHRLRIIDRSSTNDPFLDETLNFLSRLVGDKKIKYYIERILHNGFLLFPLFMERLKYLRFMNITIIPMMIFGRSFPSFTIEYVNEEIKEAVENKLKEVLLGDHYVPNKAMWYLISLLRATNRYRHIFGSEYKHQVKSRIKQLIIDEPIGKSVLWRIREIEASEVGNSPS